MKKLNLKNILCLKSYKFVFDRMIAFVVQAMSKQHRIIEIAHWDGSVQWAWSLNLLNLIGEEVMNHDVWMMFYNSDDYFQSAPIEKEC